MQNTEKIASFSYLDFIWTSINFICTPIKLIYDTVPTLARITGWSHLAGHMFLQTTALASIDWAIYSFKQEMNKILSNVILDQYNTLTCDNASENTCSSKGPEVWEKFENTFAPIVPIVLGMLALQTVKSMVERYCQISLARKLEDSLHERKLSNQAAYRMSFSRDGEFLMRSISDDAEKFCEVNALMTSAFSASQNALMVVRDLTRLSTFITIGPIAVPDLVLFSLGYGLTTNLITQWLGSCKVGWNKKLDQITTDLKSREIDDDTKIKIITQSGGEQYAMQQQKTLLQELRRVDNVVTGIEEVQKIWQNWHSTIYNIGKFYFFGWKLFTQSLLYEYRWTVHETLTGIEPAFCWAEANNNKVNSTLIVNDRIKRFLDEVDRINGTPSDLQYTSNSSNSLFLKGVRLSAGGAELLRSTNYTFKMGGRYLLQGPAGNGKSTILDKIMGLSDAGGVTSAGAISLPEGKTVRLLTQGDFFSYGETLREALYYPDSPPSSSEQKEVFMRKATDLLEEMKFCDKNSRSVLTELLDSREDLYTRLSGGQKKKVQIVAQIMKKPDILMLDESLNGMDEESKKTTLRILKRELPGSMILVVDHNGDKDKDFYDKHLMFKKHSLQEVASRSR